jgi:hypothetical protein
LGDVRPGLSTNFKVRVEDVALELTMSLKLKSKNVKKQDEFTLPWYEAGEKARKTKMGSLYRCEIEGKSNYLMRVISCKRISEYQIDAYFN